MAELKSSKIRNFLRNVFNFESSVEAHNKRPASCSEMMYLVFVDPEVFRGAIRFTVLSLVFFAVTFWISLTIFKSTASGCRIGVTDTGGFVLELPDQPKTAWFLLSPTGGQRNPTKLSDFSPWIDTGIKIRKGEEVKISASGRVCTAYHRIIEAALEKGNEVPPHPWVGPEGWSLGDDDAPPHKPRDSQKEYRVAPLKMQTPLFSTLLLIQNPVFNSAIRISEGRDNRDVISQDFLVCKEQNQGLLMGIVSNKTPPISPKSDEIWFIGEKNGKEFIADKTGTLWLTINDIWVNPYNKSMCEKIDPDTKGKLDYLLDDHKYYNMWYDDNAGFFFVVIEFES